MQSRFTLVNGLIMALTFTAILLLMLSLPSFVLAQDLEVEALVKQITVSLPQETAIYSFNEAAAAAAKPAPAWTKFQAKHPTWNWVWWNPYAKVPQRAAGEAISIPGITQVTKTNVEEAAWKALDLLGDLTGVPKKELRLARTFRVKDYWMVSFYQVHNGMQVLWSEVELRVSADGRLIAFGVETAPGLSLQNPGSGSNQKALLDNAQAGLPEIAKTQTPPAVSGPFILPIANRDRIDYRTVYQVDAVTPDSIVLWTAWVDANDGTVLKRELAIEFQNVSGTVSGDVHPSMLATPVTVNFLYQNIAITSLPSMMTATVAADATGVYMHTLVGGSTSAIINTRLDGPVIEILNDAPGGSNASYTNVEGGPFPAVHNIAWTNANSTIGERDVFYHTNLIFEHVASIDDALGVMPDFRSNFIKLANSTVNDNGFICILFTGSCNAFYSPTSHSLHFCDPAITVPNPCVNLAEIPPVIYHEWGHSRHFEQNRIAGATMDPDPSQLKEAVGDITAAYFLDNSIIPHPDPSMGALRDVNNVFQYPVDFAALGLPHKQSQILSGALWDMRENLIVTHGVVAGKQLAEELFHVAQYGGAAHTSSIAAWVQFLLDILIADDNDLNLANGTPNFVDIQNAFQAHGIWPTNLGVGPDPTNAHAQIVLVIDRSGSMGGGFPTTRISQAKIAANAFIALMGDHDRVGISNFNHTHDPALDHPLVELTAANRATLQSLINSFTPAGATNYIEGLQHGQLILNPGMGVPGGPPEQFIVMLGDGEHNTPSTDPVPVLNAVNMLPPTTRVYTIYLSSDAAGEMLMQDMAATRDGAFLNAPDNDDLLRTYIDMYAIVMGRDLIFSYTQLVNPLSTRNGSTATDTTTVSQFVCIGSATSDVQFLGNWTGRQDSTISGMVEVIDPIGSVINASNAHLYPGGSSVETLNGENIRINRPLHGQWTMRARVSGLAEVEVNLNCLARSDRDMGVSSGVVGLGQNERGHVVKAKLMDVHNNYDGAPIINAKVIAMSGRGQPYTLLDDGQHFDGLKNDGIYGSLVKLESDTVSTSFNIEATYSDGGLACKLFGSASILDVSRTVLLPKPAGWSLTSLPVAPRDSSLQKLFPRAQGAFSFDPKEGYKFLQELPTRVGFWLNEAVADTNLIQGTPVTAYSLALPKGWSLIGGLYNQAAIPSTKPDEVIQAMFRFDPKKGYEQTIRVLPGEAVWVNCAEACSLTMAQNSFSNFSQEAAQELPWQTTITATGELVGTAVNVSNVVIAGSNAGASTVIAPPPPPQYTTNLQLWTLNFAAGPFARDTRVTNTAESMWVLEVDPHGNVPPPTPRNTTVSWEAATLGTGTWELRNGFDGTGAIRIADMRTTTSFVVTANSSQFFTIIFKPLITGVEDNKETSRLPDRFALYQNYPNPFNPETEIHYDLPKASRLTLTIYNLTGQAVRTLVEGTIPAGSYTARWNGRDDKGRRVAGGIYFYQLRAGDFV